jgi:hypothetical protein
MIQSNDFQQSILELMPPNGPNADRRPDDLQGCLTPLVSLALRKGVGMPALVTWVRAAHARISEGARPEPPERYASQITRLLCATLLRDARSDPNERPRNRGELAAW